jgi:hypothetical protein
VRTCLREVEQGHAADVVVRIIASQEYEERMLGHGHPSRRRR